MAKAQQEPPPGGEEQRPIHQQTRGFSKAGLRFPIRPAEALLSPAAPEVVEAVRVSAGDGSMQGDRPQL